MKLPITLLSIICLVIFTACQTTPATQYEYAGISFTSPAGWKITRDDHEGIEHYVYVEKSGFNDSGLITITWIDGEYNWERYMEITRETFEEKEIMKNLVFYNASDTVFNGYNALTSNYIFNVMNMPHRGKVLILGDEEKIISIVMQEANEDIRKNKEGFVTFVESFSFK